MSRKRCDSAVRTIKDPGRTAALTETNRELSREVWRLKSESVKYERQINALMKEFARANDAAAHHAQEMCVDRATQVPCTDCPKEAVASSEPPLMRECLAPPLRAPRVRAPASYAEPSLKVKLRQP